MDDARNLKRTFWRATIPAVLITVLGLVYLALQVRRDVVQADRRRLERIEHLAADFQDAIRDGSETNDAARVLALQTWKGGEGIGVVAGRFVWKPKRGIVWQENVPPALTAQLARFAYWKDWTSAGKKEARRGLLDPAPLPDVSVLWTRLDDAVYGVVFADGLILSDDAGLGQIPSAVAMCLLLAVGVLPGLRMLKRAADEARAEDAKKTAFVSNASHELKTPLAAIGLWAGLLESGRLPPDKRAHAYDVIVEENARMTRLVENLLDFSRLDQKRKTYRLEVVDLARATHDVIDLVRLDFPHGISVRGMDVCRVQADADAVRQILVNLVGNAAKYAAAGGPVELVVRAADGFGYVDVCDRGPGLDETDRARVFERFYRARAVLENTTGGLGLGLAISRGLARDLRGDLSVAPRSGGGCVFTLKLPCAVSSDS